MIKSNYRTFGMFCVSFKSCDFCGWITDHKTIIAMYTLHNNCIRMLITKCKSKIAKLFSGGHAHKIALLTDMQNISKVRCSRLNTAIKFRDIILIATPHGTQEIEEVNETHVYSTEFHKSTCYIHTNTHT